MSCTLSWAVGASPVFTHKSEPKHQQFRGGFGGLRALGRCLDVIAPHEAPKVMASLLGI